jgi:hypothetical protein
MRALNEELRTELRAEMRVLNEDLRAEMKAGDEETRHLMRILHEDVIARLTLIQEAQRSTSTRPGAGKPPRRSKP